MGAATRSLAASLLALLLCACDGTADPGADPGNPNSRGGTAVDGADATPVDPGQSCSEQTGYSTILCDAGGGNAPMYNVFGSQCVVCQGINVPDLGCMLHVQPQTVVIDGHTVVVPPQYWCVTNCGQCHEPADTCLGKIVPGGC